MIKIEPIGFVRNDFEDQIPENYQDLSSEIVLDAQFTEAVHRIEENSHIVVLFWLDRVEEEKRQIRKLHPKGRSDLPLVGVLATRSPNRPNPLGMRAVRLVSREKNVLTVVGLDALNKSPVLDIKPYSLKHDLVEGAKGPPWIKRLREGPQ